MKWCPLVCVALWLNVFSPLNSQILTKPESILIHATIQRGGGIPLNMVVSSKTQKYIRASIFNATKTAGATIVYNSRTIQTVEESGSERSIRTLSGEDAAGNLFDLIALNPDYHFRKNDGFNFKIPVLEGYHVELRRDRKPIENTDRYLPNQLLLYKVSDAGNSLIRSIEYISFFEEIAPYFQPKEITFTDEENGEQGRITIQKVEYNVGLPDFLFSIKDDTKKIEQ
jgi:outer membrane lipoprotein-sorting protein